MLESGVVNIYKEKGFTSHDVVAVVRRTLRVKAGHTGTLDPQAEGVLPICLGRATKIAGLLTACEKSYRAELVLGIQTDTGDLSGTVLSERADFVFDEERIAAVIASFQGVYWQTPPMYSAIKVDGKKLYQLARAGQTVERTPRPVTIDRIVPVAFDPDGKRVWLDVDCQKGTYIRTLCEDIGQKLGCGGCMGELVRTRAGIFRVADSVRLADLRTDRILPVDAVLPFAKVRLKQGERHQAYRKLAVNGSRIPLWAVAAERRLAEDELVLLYDEDALFGIYRVRENNLILDVFLYAHKE